MMKSFSTDLESYAELDPKRIAAIETILSQEPAGFGKPISDRDYWNDPQTRLLVGDAVQTAETLLNEPFPAWSDDLYLDYIKTGTRPAGDAMQRARLSWLQPLVLAECLENQGRFLPALSTAITGYVTEPCWTMPAHDAGLTNFHRTHYAIELRSAAVSAALAQALFLLGNRFDSKLRLRLLDALEERCFGPVRASLITGNGHGWLHSNHNWNAVCLAGVVLAAVTVIPDRHDRAVFAAMGEHYCSHFLSSYASDGFCEEGAGYWAYGFGNFVALREALVQATRGGIELFSERKIVNIALYGLRLQLNDRLMPPYADCRSGVRANEDLVGYCNQSLNLGLTGLPDGSNVGNGSLGTHLMIPTPCTSLPKTEEKLVDVRSYFTDAGVLVCRPSNSESRLAASIKAGGNGDHSHNDIGSFLINLGKDLQLGEAGGPYVFNSETFGPKRYTFKILNSFGHPVPVVAGRLQLDANTIEPIVLSTSFSDIQDTISIDLTSAYDAPELKRLVRTMRYGRQGVGEVVIEDAVEFTTPSTFETALTTRGLMQQSDAHTMIFTEQSERLEVTIEAPIDYTVRSEDIQELSAPVYTRIGITLAQPVMQAVIRMTFRPVSELE